MAKPHSEMRQPGPALLADIEDLSGTLSQRVHHSLRDAILSMRFPPGMVLRKNAICEQLGVSRSPVSEAIARLASEGLVDVVPQSGTRVTRLSMEEIREATFLREALELAAVERVAGGRTGAQLTELARIARLQQLLLEDGDFQGFFLADEAFHAKILEFTGYPGAASVAASVSLQLKRARLLLLPDATRTAEFLAEHGAILQAIRDRDPQRAREAMGYHLSQLMRRIGPLEESHPEYFAPGFRRRPGELDPGSP